MLKLTLLAAAAASLIALAATPASAETVTEVFTGTVTSGFDFDHLFGGGNLKGDAYREVFTIDTSTGFDVLGALVNADITSSITIDGKTFSGGEDFTSIAINDGTDGGFGQMSVATTGLKNGHAYLFNADLTTLTEGSEFPSALGDHYDPIQVGGGVYAPKAFNNVTIAGEYIGLQPCSAAPEPTTWALMFGGLAMIGGMLRIAKARRREDEATGIATA